MVDLITASDAFLYFSFTADLAYFELLPSLWHVLTNARIEEFEDPFFTDLATPFAIENFYI